MANMFDWMALHFFLRLPWLVFVVFSSSNRYLLCAIVFLVQAEIFDKHFMVLLVASKIKMKSKQIPQNIKE